MKISNACKNLATKLNEDGIKLTATYGGFISDYLSMVDNRLDFMNSEYDKYDYMDVVTSTDIEMTKSRIIENIIVILKSKINFIKTTIIPQISYFSDKLKDMIDPVMSNNPVEGLEIKFIKTPELFYNTEYMSTIESTKGNNTELTYGLSFNKLFSVGNIKEKCIQSNDSINIDVSNFIDNLPESFVIDTWNTYMVDVTNRNDAFMELRRGLSLRDLDTCILLSLMSQGLYSQSLSDGDTLAALQFLSHTSELVFRLYSMLERYKNVKTLVVNKHDNCIHVVHDVYKEFIKSNSIDIIYGLIVYPGMISSVSGILKEKDDIKRGLDRFLIVNKGKQKRIQIDKCKNYAKVVFNKCYPFIEVNIPDKYKDESRIKKDVSTFIDSLVYTDFEDIDKLSMYIMCNHVFHFVESYDFLLTMEESYKDNPKLSPDDASIVSTIKYVNKFLVDNLSNG